MLDISFLPVILQLHGGGTSRAKGLSVDKLVNVEHLQYASGLVGGLELVEIIRVVSVTARLLIISCHLGCSAINLHCYDFYSFICVFSFFSISCPMVRCYSHTSF